MDRWSTTRIKTKHVREETATIGATLISKDLITASHPRIIIAHLKSSAQTEVKPVKEAKKDGMRNNHLRN
jgi:hypothetical protein